MNQQNTNQQNTVSIIDKIILRVVMMAIGALVFYLVYMWGVRVINNVPMVQAPPVQLTDPQGGIPAPQQVIQPTAVTVIEYLIQDQPAQVIASPAPIIQPEVIIIEVTAVPIVQPAVQLEAVALPNGHRPGSSNYATVQASEGVQVQGAGESIHNQASNSIGAQMANFSQPTDYSAIQLMSCLDIRDFDPLSMTLFCTETITSERELCTSGGENFGICNRVGE